MQPWLTPPLIASALAIGAWPAQLDEPQQNSSPSGAFVAHPTLAFIHRLVNTPLCGTLFMNVVFC